MTEAGRVLEWCRREDLLPESGIILAAVSGGKDSMCMLDLLLTLSRTCGFTVAAAHYNHRLRGTESDGDERFVREYCEKRNVPLICGGGDVSRAAKERQTGIEETARDMRYAFLEEAARTCGAARVATAHTADDNAETVLMNLLRGTGLAGLCGIPPKRDLYIRPLLCLTEEEVLAYLETHAIEHREDSTNAEDDCVRNRIRHGVMPELRRLCPDAAQRVFSATELLRLDEAVLEEAAQAFLGDQTPGKLSCKALAALPEPVAARVLRRICPCALNRAHVEAVLRLCSAPSPHGRVSLPGITLARTYDELTEYRETEVSPEPISLDGREGSLTWGKWRVTWKTEEYPGGIHKTFTDFHFKVTEICGKITLRSRREGDKLQPEGRGCEKTLKKLFLESRVAPAERACIPVLADEAGILAVAGLAVRQSEKPLPGEQTIHITFTLRSVPE